MSYNGYANYETWVVGLWIDNTEGENEYWLEQARNSLEDAEGNVRQAAYELATLLREHHDELAPGLAGVYADLMNAALSEVDWDELAVVYINQALEDESA